MALKTLPTGLKGNVQEVHNTTFYQKQKWPFLKTIKPFHLNYSDLNVFSTQNKNMVINFYNFSIFQYFL